MGLKINLTNIQNVAPGNTATLKVPVGPSAPTLDKLLLTLSGGLTVAKIESIKGKANGRLFYDEALGGAQVNLREAYKGIFNSTTVLPIDFTESKARNGAVEQLMASVPLSLLQDLTFEFKLASDAPAGSKIDVQAIVRQPTQNPWILKFLNTTQSFSASGQQIVYLPTGGAGGKFKRIWIKEGTPGTIDKVELRMGNTTMYETSRATLEHEQKRNGLTPQTGVVCLDFVEDGNLSGVLDTKAASQVELRVNSTEPNNYTIEYEFVDPIGNL